MPPNDPDGSQPPSSLLSRSHRTVVLSIHLRELGHFVLPSLRNCLDYSCLGDPFILARTVKRTLLFSPQGQGVEGGKGRSTEEASRRSTPSGLGPRTQRRDIRAAGRTQGGAVGGKPGQASERTGPAACSVTTVGWGQDGFAQECPLGRCDWPWWRKLL